MKDRTSPTTTEPLVVDSDAAAETIGLQKASLTKDRRTGHLGIPYVKAGRRVLYCLSDLKTWLEDQRQLPQKTGDTHE